MHIQAKIQKWGNSLALRLSGPIKDIPHFKENMLVDIDIAETGIYVQPVVELALHKLRFSEAQLLKGITPKMAHADERFKLSGLELPE